VSALQREWAQQVAATTDGSSAGGGIRVRDVDPLVTAYLDRLGLDPLSHSGAGSTAGLRALHRAHVERVPYETVGIALGRPVGIEPRESAARIASGWGGYCYHLNGAFGWLLTQLGYAVRFHRGGVHQSVAVPARALGATGNHVALTVAVEGHTWLVDVGLGDGLWEPLPLMPGRWRQGPNGPTEFVLRRSDAERDGWRLDHDPWAQSFAGMDFVTAVSGADLAEFEVMHAELSSDPASMFVRWVVVVRRDADSITRVRNCLVTHLNRDRIHSEVIRDRETWWSLVETLGLAPETLSASERAALWMRLDASQRAWEERVAKDR
jgi:N-hydroxyarylamine O-acetyltransferase